MIDGIPNRHLYFYQKDIIDEERLPQKWNSRGVTTIALTDWSYFLQEQQDQVPFIDFRFWQTGAPWFQEMQILDFCWSGSYLYIYIMYLNHWIGGFLKSGYLLKSSIFNHVHRISHELSHPVLAWGTSYGNLHCPSCVAQSTSGDWTDKAGYPCPPRCPGFVEWLFLMFFPEHSLRWESKWGNSWKFGRSEEKNLNILESNPASWFP